MTGHDGFLLEIAGGNTALTYQSGEGTNTLVFSTVPEAGEGEEVILDYGQYLLEISPGKYLGYSSFFSASYSNSEFSVENVYSDVRDLTEVESLSLYGVKDLLKRIKELDDKLYFKINVVKVLRYADGKGTGGYWNIIDSYPVMYLLDQLENIDS